MNESDNLANLYILLVEPSKTQFHVIHDYLSGFGLSQIVSVESGAEALALMESEKPDLVVSAMHLPDMTGAELVTTMREDDSLRDISFILISSETGVRYLEPIKQAGVVAILPKPFNRAQLKRALFTSLDFLEAERLELDQFEPEDLSVLVVDDSDMARHHIRRVLNALGFDNITEVADGREAVKMIDERYFDLVVSDYYMPAMDGTELANYIRENSKQPGVPILMVTSEENESRLAAIEQSGVSAVCGKPFEVSALRNLITTLLQS